MKRNDNRDHGEVVVTIADTGRGIDSDVMPDFSQSLFRNQMRGLVLGFLFQKYR
jgi:hypothetical protein